VQRPAVGEELLLEYTYTSLRDQARQHGKTANYYFRQAKAAYQRSDRVRAAQMSQKGKWEAQQRDLKDAQAHEEIFEG
jgi:hypothetical protein